MRMQSILQREGIRQLPKICWYLKSARLAVKQGGTADKVLFVLGISFQGRFLLEAAMKLFNLTKRWCE
ncbi:MAG: hypothetical protein J6L88_09950 [Clostridia bacterium]|nr:hypothetical protein [Clostridia bacterium]